VPWELKQKVTSSFVYQWNKQVVEVSDSPTVYVANLIGKAWKIFLFDFY
jgi:hypothetical protein